MKKLLIFGDSIIKGVTYNGQSYHLCQQHDFDALAAQGITVENNAKMGATIADGLRQISRKLKPCADDTTVLFCFGGNDCDYNWKDISDAPDAEHLPHRVDALLRRGGMAAHAFDAHAQLSPAPLADLDRVGGRLTHDDKVGLDVLAHLARCDPLKALLMHGAGDTKCSVEIPLGLVGKLCGCRDQGGHATLHVR